MGALTKKQFGTIKQAMQGFLGKKSLTFPQSIDEFKVPDAMFRRFKLDDRRLALMTEFGWDCLKTIVKELDGADVFDGNVNYSDVHSGCVTVLGRCLLQDCKPSSGEEFVAMVSAEVEMNRPGFAGGCLV